MTEELGEDWAFEDPLSLMHEWDPELREDYALMRAAFLTPCEDKEALSEWIRFFLRIDLPDSIVDQDSNTCPLEAAWLIYNQAIHVQDPTFSRVMLYSSRDSYKTLLASILEVVMLIHGRRDVAHMAAIEAQAQKSQTYVAKFLSMPYLRDFVSVQNKRKIEFCRYVEDGEPLESAISPVEYAQLDQAEKQKYLPHNNYIVIVIATVQGANGEHVPFFVCDEVDVIADPQAYEEAKMIPSMGKEGQPPITLLISTRKTAGGLVQKEIDEAHKTHTKVVHWNILDVTEKCPPERHLPHEPKQKVYINEPLLKVIQPNEFEVLPDQERNKYLEVEAFHGCMKCPLLAACKTRLATVQSDKAIHARRGLYKPIQTVISSNFLPSSLDFANAQLLCRKPSTEGLIYPSFDKDVHCLTPQHIAAMITGEPLESFDSDMSVERLITLCSQLGADFVGGIDWGYTDLFTFVFGVIWGNAVYILDGYAEAGLETLDQFDVTYKMFGEHDPRIWADPENPQAIKTFKKNGFFMKNWSKKPGSVLGGIEIVRGKMRPLTRKPEIILNADSGFCMDLAAEIAKYQWKTTPDGRYSRDPKKGEDHRVDAMRYLIMNEFGKDGSRVIAENHDATSIIISGDYTEENFFDKLAEEHGYIRMVRTESGEWVNKDSEDTVKDKAGRRKGSIIIAD